MEGQVKPKKLDSFTDIFDTLYNKNKLYNIYKGQGVFKGFVDYNKILSYTKEIDEDTLIPPPTYPSIDLEKIHLTFKEICDHFIDKENLRMLKLYQVSDYKYPSLVILVKPEQIQRIKEFILKESNQIKPLLIRKLTYVKDDEIINTVLYIKYDAHESCTSAKNKLSNTFNFKDDKDIFYCADMSEKKDSQWYCLVVMNIKEDDIHNVRNKYLRNIDIDEIKVLGDAIKLGDIYCQAFVFKNPKLALKALKQLDGMDKSDGTGKMRCRFHINSCKQGLLSFEDEDIIDKDYRGNQRRRPNRGSNNIILNAVLENKRIR